MRITNRMMINNTLDNLNTGLGRVSKLHNQLASNRRIVNLSDDPIGVMNSLGARTQIRRLEQYQRNVTNSRSWVQQTETAMSEMNELIVSCKELLTDSMGTENADDKKIFATQIRQYMENLLELCNTAMGDKYVFGGYNVTKQPFSAERDALGNLTAVYYNGLDLTGKNMVGSGPLSDCIFDMEEAGMSQLSWSGRLDVQGSFETEKLVSTNEDGSSRYGVRFHELDSDGKRTGKTYDAFMKLPSKVDQEGDFVNVRLETEDGISFGTVSWKNASTEVKVTDDQLADAIASRSKISTTSEGNKTIQIGPEADSGIIWNGTLGDTSQKYQVQVDGDTLRFVNLNGSEVGSYKIDASNMFFDKDGVLERVEVDLADVGPHPGLGKIEWFAAKSDVKFTNNPKATAEDVAALLGTAEFVTTPLGEESTQRIQIEIGFEMNLDVTFTGIDLLGTGDDNIFNVLMNIADDLQAGKRNEDLTGYLTDLSKAQDRILTQIVKSGNRTTKLDTMVNRYSLDAINYESKRSAIEDIDQAKVITEMKYAEMIYQQALASGSKIIQPTLMDYLR